MTTKPTKPYYDLTECRDVFDIVRQRDLSFELGSALKYIVRCGRKDGAEPVEDLEKAVSCLAREIERRTKA